MGFNLQPYINAFPDHDEPDTTYVQFEVFVRDASQLSPTQVALQHGFTWSKDTRNVHTDDVPGLMAQMLMALAHELSPDVYHRMSHRYDANADQFSVAVDG